MPKSAKQQRLPYLVPSWVTKDPALLRELRRRGFRSQTSAFRFLAPIAEKRGKRMPDAFRPTKRSDLYRVHSVEAMYGQRAIRDRRRTPTGKVRNWAKDQKNSN